MPTWSNNCCASLMSPKEHFHSGSESRKEINVYCMYMVNISFWLFRVPRREYHDTEHKIYVNSSEHVFMGNQKAQLEKRRERQKNFLLWKTPHKGNRFWGFPTSSSASHKKSRRQLFFPPSWNILNSTCDLTLDTLFKNFIYIFLPWVMFNASTAWQKSIMLINKFTISHDEWLAGRKENKTWKYTARQQQKATFISKIINWIRLSTFPFFSRLSSTSKQNLMPERKNGNGRKKS